MDRLAEEYTALAVKELAQLFPDTPPADRAELYQLLRGPVLSAVLGCLAHALRKRVRRPDLSPSAN
ncbi:MAG TPA: hypothetical protein VD866_20160 [Urbifossiella sp.]|nr:hypothetical protein [Urbifossiella sp.]